MPAPKQIGDLQEYSARDNSYVNNSATEINKVTDAEWDVVAGTESITVLRNGRRTIPKHLVGSRFGKEMSVPGCE